MRKVIYISLVAEVFVEVVNARVRKENIYEDERGQYLGRLNDNKVFDSKDAALSYLTTEFNTFKRCYVAYHKLDVIALSMMSKIMSVSLAVQALEDF